MRNLLPSLVLTALAFLVLRSLSPAVRTRRGAALFAGAAALAHLGLLAARLPGAGPLAEVGPRVHTAWFVAATMTALGGGALLLLGGLRRRATALALGAAPVASQAAPVDLARRQFLGGFALPAAATAVSAGGSVSALRDFEVRHEEVRVRGLPAALDGLKVGQLTDVHVGDFIDTDYLARAVRALDAEGVDVQVMTGDLLDDLTQLEASMDALEACRAPLGMVAILGNHEKWRGEEEVLAAYARRAPAGRLRLLLDESLVLEHRGAPLRVVGVDYPMRRGGSHQLPREERLRMMAASAQKAWAGVAAGEPVLCLTHHPDFFPFAAERGAFLTLAGHTHGGQVGFLGIPLFAFAFDYMAGRYRRDGAHLYVGRGTGHWLPFRIGMPTEVTVLTLRAAA
jgi:predicted MPP superfamily phosphohydrolase